MERSLRTLLDGVIDYAGLFPPAKLAMEPAVEELLGYLEGENDWLVTRFACSASRLAELAEELEKHTLTEPMPIAVIGTSGKDKHHWDTALAHDEQLMAKFQQLAGMRAQIEAYEIRLPDNHHCEACLKALDGSNPYDVFVEIPWTEGMEESLACLAESDFAYAKARTGGLDAAAFPSVGELASFVQQCVQLDVPFKLTAGLHEPLLHTDKATGFEHHGFLNVLVATVLTAAHELNRREIEQVLSVKQGHDFAFTQDVMRWRSFEANLDEIRDGRDLILSFGSCSLEEPLEGLAKAGLLTVHA